MEIKEVLLGPKSGLNVLRCMKIRRLYVHVMEIVFVVNEAH